MKNNYCTYKQILFYKFTNDYGLNFAFVIFGGSQRMEK